MKKPDQPIIAFESTKKMESWMKKNHDSSDGIWLRMYKKDSNIPSVTYKEALDVALCFGWIDGQANPDSENSWIQRFTPRRARSMWSKRNIEHAERLIKEKRMQPVGLEAIKAAKADGRWERAYDGSAAMVVPEDFIKELKKNKKAYEFFLTLNKANTYAIAWRLQTAKKPETRERRLKVLLEMMKKGQKLH